MRAVEEPSRGSNQCEHGSLARSCLTCELIDRAELAERSADALRRELQARDAEIARLRAEFAEACASLAAEVNRREQLEAALQQASHDLEGLAGIEPDRRVSPTVTLEIQRAKERIDEVLR